jgi:hypothetical protein
MSDLIAICNMWGRFGICFFEGITREACFRETAWDVQRFENERARGHRFLTLKMQHYKGFCLPTKLAHGRCCDFWLAMWNTTKDSAYPPSWHPGGVTLFGLQRATLCRILLTQQAGTREV